MAKGKPSIQPHYYGGQALLEGVMMRGRDRWAVAVRRPSREIYIEQHPVRSLATKYPIFRKPLFRGVAAMGEALSIGMRAMMISANQSLEEEQKLSSKQMGGTIAFALIVFFVIFILFPNLLSNLFGHTKHKTASHSILQNVYEGLIRLAIFVGYLALIWLQILERLGGIFLIAGISYEGLRLGAAKTGNPFVRALMKPGLWLQKITTRQPEHDQIEVAIRSFEAVLPQEERMRVAALPSPLIAGDSLHETD